MEFTMDVPYLIVAGLLPVFAFIVIARSAVIVPRQNAYIVERLGLKASEAGKQRQINEAQGRAEAVTVAGGTDAVRLRVAEQYISQLGKLVGSSNTLVLPASVADVGSMVALAMNVFQAQRQDGDTASAPGAPSTRHH